jgi:hypothetical protein
MKHAIASALVLLLGVFVWTAPAAAKGNKGKDPCRKADIKLALTGQGDADGDGVSDCREEKVLRTDPRDADTDDDGMDDGDEIAHFCHAKNPDTDDDGVDDGTDDTPAIEQEMVAILDALTCPVPATSPETLPVNGSLSALGTTAAVTVDTEFEDKSCEDLVARLALGQPIVVEVEIFEDMLGALTATEVEVKFRHHRGDDDGDHHGDDDHDDDDDQGEDD